MSEKSRQPPRYCKAYTSVQTVDAALYTALTTAAGASERKPGGRLEELVPSEDLGPGCVEINVHGPFGAFGGFVGKLYIE